MTSNIEDSSLNPIGGWEKSGGVHVACDTDDESHSPSIREPRRDFGTIFLGRTRHRNHSRYSLVINPLEEDVVELGALLRPEVRRIFSTVLAKEA